MPCSADTVPPRFTAFFTISITADLAISLSAEFLVKITNDAWFGKTAEPTQHLAASVFRAIENRKYVVRCANTGISGFVSPYGRLDLLNDGELFVSGAHTKKVYPNTRRSFYTRHGSILFFVYMLILLIIILLDIRHSRRISN